MKTDDWLILMTIVVVALAIGVTLLLGRNVVRDFGYDPTAADIERLLDWMWRLHNLILDRCWPR